MLQMCYEIFQKMLTFFRSAVILHMVKTVVLLKLLFFIGVLTELKGI